MKMLAISAFWLCTQGAMAFDLSTVPHAVTWIKVDKGVLAICKAGELVNIETTAPGHSFSTSVFVYYDKSEAVNVWLQISGSVPDFNRMLGFEMPGGFAPEFISRSWLKVLDEIYFDTPSLTIADSSGRLRFDRLTQISDESDWSKPHVAPLGEAELLKILLQDPTVSISGNTWVVAYSVFDRDRDIVFRFCYGTLNPASISATSSHVVLDWSFWQHRQLSDLTESTRRFEALRQTLLGEFSAWRNSALQIAVKPGK